MQTQNILFQIPINKVQAVKDILSVFSEAIGFEIKEVNDKKTTQKRDEFFKKYVGIFDADISEDEVKKIKAKKYGE